MDSKVVAPPEENGDKGSDATDGKATPRPVTRVKGTLAPVIHLPQESPKDALKNGSS